MNTCNKQLFKLQKIFISSILISIFMLPGAINAAQGSDLSATVSYKNPKQPALILTNISSSACQVVESSLGSISISNVTQNGKVVESMPLQVGIGEGLEVVLQKKLKTLEPKKSVEIPILVSGGIDQTVIIRARAGKATEATQANTVDGTQFSIRSITWSQSSGAFGMVYQLQSDKPYVLQATYAAPIIASTGAPMCAMVTSGSTDASSVGQFLENPVLQMFLGYWKIALVILGLIVLLIIAWLMRKKPNKVLKSIVIFVILSLATGVLSPVRASYSVPESALGRFDECLALFDRYPDITGPVLDALDSRRIVIHATTGGENYSTDYPDGSFHIYWDPHSSYNYHSDDGSVIPSTPCDRLFHEMFHIYDMLSRTFDRDDCAGSGIETKEVEATRAQNRLRVAMGLPPRTHYGTTRLPEGDCNAPPPPRACTGRGCAETTGDPHLKTFDEKRYGFQAAGEFVLARSTGSAKVSGASFEVQTRQQPWANSRYVSLNTAVAMQVGADKVEVSIQKSVLTLLVNGKNTPLVDTKLTGGGSINVSGVRAVSVTWPDSSKTHITTIGIFGLDILVNPTEARGGKVEGLLGNYNGDPKDDLKAGNASPIEPTHDVLYPNFADSWRVTDQTSLFTYAAGNNTKTFTDRSFPDKFDFRNNLPNRAAAEALCKSLNIIDAVILENCIIDVALTGRPEFARSAQMSQLGMVPVSAKSTDFGGQTWTMKVPKSDKPSTVTFQGKANQKVFVDVSKSDLPNSCGKLNLIAPSNDTLNSGCIINGLGLIDSTTLPADGTYTISIRGSDDTAGSAFIRLIMFEDQVSTITPDGPPVTAIITKPGAKSIFSFEGKKDQKVFVDITNATIPDQCGGISIKATGNIDLGAGCIINGKGDINTETLPADGRYRIVINPSDTNIGTATLKLILAQDVKNTLPLDNTPVTASLTKPGSRAIYTFTGKEGQRVFMDISQSTLPDQCGGITLTTPDGSPIESGCIINGKGRLKEQGVVLPQSGEYTFSIDPGDNIVGDVSVRGRM